MEANIKAAGLAFEIG